MERERGRKVGGMEEEEEGHSRARTCPTTGWILVQEFPSAGAVKNMTATPPPSPVPRCTLWRPAERPTIRVTCKTKQRRGREGLREGGREGASGSIFSIMTSLVECLSLLSRPLFPPFARDDPGQWTMARSFAPSSELFQEIPVPPFVRQRSRINEPQMEIKAEGR